MVKYFNLGLTGGEIITFLANIDITQRHIKRELLATELRRAPYASLCSLAATEPLLSSDWVSLTNKGKLN